MPTHLLLKGGTLWGLNNIFSPPESGLEKFKKSGVSFLEVSDSLLTPELIETIQGFGLGIIVQAYPQTVAEFNATLDLAARTRARAINVHAGHPYLSTDEAIALASGLIEAARHARVPLYFETHRGRITQNLVQAAQLATALPDMRFTLDVSHFVLCEEQPGPTERLAPHLDKILDQTEMIHGRISSGQQIQVHTIDPVSDITTRHTALWAEAMRRWRHRNKPGSSLLFTPELGPPPYSIVDADGNELSNRLEQSDRLWELAQSAWKQSAIAGKNACWPAQM